MCGIVGVLGKNEVAPILVEALKRLEYRGYDSAGVATIEHGQLDRRRAIGKLVELSDALVREPLRGRAGIGHTRWATHGKPTLSNAHPHQFGAVSVVHNGIIENFRELRRELSEHNIHAETDTDTETIAMLTGHFIAKGQSPIDAVRSTLKKLDGAFAVCFLFAGYDDLMIAARKGSPLAIGYGKGEMFVGSDAIALTHLTNQLSYLEEGDFAILTRESVEIRDKDGQPVQREKLTIRDDNSHYDKDGFTHFMEKEVFEQPSVIKTAITQYFNPEKAQETQLKNIDFSRFDKVLLIACGTGYYACLTAKYWLEQLADMPAEIDIASEFRYREPPITPNTLAIFVSQSGETADTLAALHYCAGKAAEIWSVTNVAESSIARESDVNFPIYAGIEIGVASTKAFTCQLTVLLAIAMKAAAVRGTMSARAHETLSQAIFDLPALINRALDQREAYQIVANDLAKTKDILFLGRGLMYPLALEGALKLKEISYIHAEAYAGGELKHGPIALVDSALPVVIFAPKDAVFKKTVSNMQEVMARKGKIALFSEPSGFEVAEEELWHQVPMPPCHEALTPILYAIPAQLLAYYTAVAMGTDVDQPRNLAKSVTVE
ncbi:glutamine--fructose-6-phosphate transaminase (isomerizing) [Paracoccaceae bacterium]|nr:glutamine--fructose-6-phosphate transaminase (isomerizing) [Paracoccaceae bacterium]